MSLLLSRTLSCFTECRRKIRCFIAQFFGNLYSSGIPSMSSARIKFADERVQDDSGIIVVSAGENIYENVLIEYFHEVKQIQFFSRFLQHHYSVGIFHENWKNPRMKILQEGSEIKFCMFMEKACAVQRGESFDRKNIRNRVSVREMKMSQRPQNTTSADVFTVY